MRDADASGEMKLRLLDAILRTSKPSPGHADSSGNSGGDAAPRNAHDPARALAEASGALPQGTALGGGLVDGAAEMAPTWGEGDGGMSVKRMPLWTPEVLHLRAPLIVHEGEG